MKHLGTIDGKKVAVLFRTVPNEPTSALVVKHEELPEPLKSQFKKVLESNAGQNSLSLSDAANQFTVADGSKLLQALHKGKYLEKVVTKNVILTPNAKTMLPLDQLNNILDGAGGAKVESYKAPEPVATMQLNPGAPTMPDLNDTGALSDTQVATDLRNQANGLMREAERMLSEAETLSPAPPKRRGRPAKTTA